MRLVFAGTPWVAVPSLDALISSEHELAAVITRPDAPTGRKRALTPSPVAVRAEEAGIPVLRAARADDALTAAVADLEADLGVVVAYGALLREPLLSAPRLGWINLHFSLLPRWRGAAPVQRAVMAGETTTGASVFQLEAGMDTGPVFATLTHPIEPTDTAGALLEALSHSGATLLRSVVDDLATGAADSTPQVGDVTLAPKLALADARIDPRGDARSIAALIRGTTPEPGAHLMLGDDRFKVLDFALPTDEERVPVATIMRRGSAILLGTSTDPIELLTVHPAGKRPMPAADWWRGRSSDEPLVIAVAS